MAVVVVVIVVVAFVAVIVVVDVVFVHAACCCCCCLSFERAVRYLLDICCVFLCGVVLLCDVTCSVCSVLVVY